MNRKLWYLKQINLFKTLEREELEHLASHLSAKEYGKRQVILEPRDKDKVFVLKTGRVEIYEITPDGKKIIVDVLGPGNVFGDLGMEDSNETFVEATTDSFVCAMNKNDFFEMVSKNSQIAYPLIRELFSKTVESKKQVASLASNNVVAKIKDLLLRLSKRYGEQNQNKTVIKAKFTHEQLADMVGISRPTMTELLNKLEKDKVIERNGKIISFDPQKVAELQ
ncbi:MAG: Crp/Fnr family transcriptional regulator [Candidatus Levybacteria bacterium]|nr:Crp/Fnr family transcriptional regulator [Candidatus Levybacteria bacterium]